MSLALPFLEVMRPTGVAAINLEPVRLAWIFFPNGVVPDYWRPKGTSSNWEFSYSLEPLREFKGDMNILRGLAQSNANSLGDGSGDHARSASAYLTGVHPFKSSGSKIRVGRSADQIAADSYGQQTRVASIELGTEEGRDAGSCDAGYACVYSNNISWRNEFLPTGKELNPRRCFDRLFGVAGTSDPRHQKVTGSILDYISDQRKHLIDQVGGFDRQKLDQYFTGVREIEQRMTKFSDPVALPKGARVPEESPKDTTEHIRLMYDLMVLAFQTDVTRIASFMLANDGSNRTFPMIEITDGHHQLSHHEQKRDNIEKVAKIDRYYCEQFAYFLKKLRETPVSEGSLLDHSWIVYGSAINDGNAHDHHDLPILLAGRGGKRIKTGNVHEFPKLTPLNNLFRMMLDSVGADPGNFGDSTDVLEFS